MPEKAKEITTILKGDLNCLYDEKDSIGKRYRRNDAIGTPFCITVDHKTLDNNTVTLRDRDSMTQKRVEITNLLSIISSNFPFIFCCAFSGNSNLIPPSNL